MCAIATYYVADRALIIQTEAEIVAPLESQPKNYEYFHTEDING
jgi:hypothetical protein